MKKALTTLSLALSSVTYVLAQVGGTITIGNQATQGQINGSALLSLLGLAQKIVTLLVPFAVGLAVLAFFWFLITFIFLYRIYYERIMFAEEQFLRKKFGTAAPANGATRSAPRVRSANSGARSNIFRKWCDWKFIRSVFSRSRNFNRYLHDHYRRMYFHLVFHHDYQCNS